jgi:hypothetical protein
MINLRVSDKKYETIKRKADQRQISMPACHAESA